MNPFGTPQNPPVAVPALGNNNLQQTLLARGVGNPYAVARELLALRVAPGGEGGMLGFGRGALNRHLEQMGDLNHAAQQWNLAQRHVGDFAQGSGMPLADNVPKPNLEDSGDDRPNPWLDWLGLSALRKAVQSRVEG